MEMTRRKWLVLSAAAVADLSVSGRGFAAQGSQGLFAALETRSGGRLGVAYLDTGDGKTGGYRSDERFPMCSTFKLLLTATVLQRVDDGKEQLGRIVRYGKSDLLSYAPTTSQHVDNGMSVDALCEAAVTLSDNTAANLLLQAVGGPAQVTAFARALGDNLTRLDRTEPDLNESIPGDPRDTTTPSAMVADVNKLVLGDALSADSRRLLTKWLIDCKTGDKRLRAGMPQGWRVGDKTGTGPRGTANDVAVIWPSGEKAPILAAVYLTGAAGLSDDERDGVVAEAGRLIASAVRSRA